MYSCRVVSRARPAPARPNLPRCSIRQAGCASSRKGRDSPGPWRCSCRCSEQSCDKYQSLCRVMSFETQVTILLATGLPSGAGYHTTTDLSAPGAGVFPASLLLATKLAAALGPILPWSVLACSESSLLGGGRGHATGDQGKSRCDESCDEHHIVCRVEMGLHSVPSWSCLPWISTSKDRFSWHLGHTLYLLTRRPPHPPTIVDSPSHIEPR